MGLDTVARRRLTFALLLLCGFGLFLADVYVVARGTALPAVYYAVPVVIAALVLPPRMVAAVAIWVLLLDTTANWLEQPPAWLFVGYTLGVALFGLLSVALSARSAREAALTARARTDRAQAEESTTEMERQRDRARASEELLRAIVDNSPSFIYLKDLEGRYLMLNLNFENLFHRPTADMLGKTDFEVHATEEQARALRENDRRVVGAGMPLEFEEVAQRDDGPHDYISVKFPVRDATGAVYAVGGVSTDITERKRTEAERERLLVELRVANEDLAVASIASRSAANQAERQAAQMRTLVASLGEAVIIVDSERRIVLRNQTSRELSGISDEQMQHDLDERHLTYLTLDGQTASFEDTPISRALRGEQFVDHEGVMVRPDGSRRRVLVSGAGVRDEAGQVVMGLVVFRDVTDLRTLEQTREDYLRAITHDVRNPLTSVLGVAQLIDRYADRPDLVRKNSKLLADSARRVNRMLNELVESIQIESGRLRLHPRPVDLPSLATNVRDQMLGVGENRNRRVRVECPDALPPVLADPESLERIVTNLLSNALKYSEPDTEVVVEIIRRGDEAEVMVRDRGRGILAEHLPRLFDRYYREERAGPRREGLGLGLYITKGMVEANGGRIRVESEVGVGSTFTFTLPLA